MFRFRCSWSLSCHSRAQAAWRCAVKNWVALLAFLIGGSLPAANTWSQQTGGIEGVVTSNAVPQAGVAVEARSTLLPRPRTAFTNATGRYRLPMLVPGAYLLRIVAPDGSSPSVAVDVLLDQTVVVNLALEEARAVHDGPIEELQVVAQRLGERGGASLSNALGSELVLGVPVGRGFRDLMKLAPGVQYTEDGVRGPSAGGSGQDNTYRFDGADLSLPLFGTLAAEPANHDIEQVVFERGGADAVGFNRSGGFAMDSKARSGTDRFAASVEYRLQPKELVAKNRNDGKHDTIETWTTVTASGPLLPQRLFFYGSYFAPGQDRDNKATAYGPVKRYRSRRDEYFGKLTFAPTDRMLFNGGYRTSTRKDQGVSVGFYEADSVSVGERSEQEILSLDGSWQIDAATTLAFQYFNYVLKGSERPDLVLRVEPRLDGALDVNNLERMGYLNVPQTVSGADAYNAAVQPLIDRHGYLDASGNRAGGGAVGAHAHITDGNYFNQGLDVTLDRELHIGDARHSLHAGFRWAEGRESLRRTSNGWGVLEVPGGVDLAADGTPVFYTAFVEQMSLAQGDGPLVGPIRSTVESFGLEINDRVSLGRFTYNLGVLISKDVLYGQGLRRVADSYSGFERSAGTKYRMRTIPWADMIQPRLSIAWAYNDQGEAYLSFARYHPQASSLARAASWDRNSRASLRVLFDEQGRIISHAPRAGSSGKVFQGGIKPRRVDEWVLGATHRFGDGIRLGAHLRHRKGGRFWEDTWNYSRETYDNAPPDVAAKGPYVPDLETIRAEIGGSSYVIAQLDGAYTKYWEAVVELEWRGEHGYLNASYVRSRYTGNFDQDNTSGVNDANRFIGSSTLADGYGRQLWDRKDGILRGDRPHVLKAFGYYALPWQAQLGAYFIYQSGQPWEAWDAAVYGLPSYFSDANRYAERAGRQRSPSHHQLDLSYTQRLGLFRDTTAQVRVDVFNVFDRQTGYNINPFVDDAGFGEARSHFMPRRVQISVGMAL